MAKLVYSAIASLDGYVADEHDEFGWARPDAEVHAFVNELEAPLGTHLYGRRMYEVMKAWEDDELPSAADPADLPVMRDYAEIWRAAEKVVYSRTLDRIATTRTHIEQFFEPDDVRRLKERADRDIGIGGPDLASQAIAAGLVDEINLFLVPVAIGAGKAVLPVDDPLSLTLLDQRRFANGTVYLRYAVGSDDRSQ